MVLSDIVITCHLPSAFVHVNILTIRERSDDTALADKMVIL